MSGSEHEQAVLRHAFLTGRLERVLEAAARLEHVALPDALRILALLAERPDPRYERAAVRLAARIMHERRLDLAEARYVLALVEAMPRMREALEQALKRYV